jgi:transcriptional regulator with XRE-family HTH domain
MIGKILKDFRYANRMGMRELAKRLGVSVATICRIESGKPMDQETVVKLFNVLFGKQKINSEKRSRF